MLTAFRIVNAANGQTATAVMGGVNSAISRIGFTVSTLEAHYDMDGEEIAKFQGSGQWPNYEYVRRQLIHQEGKIIGADPADYNWQRRYLMLAALTDQGIQNTQFHATLYATYAGHPEVYAQVVLVDNDMPWDAKEYRSSDYMLQWRNDYGYWRLSSDNSVYKL